MSWLLTLLFSCVAAELLIRMPLMRLGRSMIRSSLRAGRVIMSPHISEHWKEIVMPAYTIDLARLTCTLCSGFAAAGIGLAVVLFVMDSFSPGFAFFLTSPAGISAGFIFSTLYLVVRRRLVRP